MNKVGNVTMLQAKRCKTCRFWRPYRGQEPTIPRRSRNACIFHYREEKDPKTGEARRQPSLNPHDCKGPHFGKRTPPGFGCSDYLRKHAPYRRPDVLDLEVGSQELRTFRENRARLEEEQLADAERDSLMNVVDSEPPVN